MPHDLGPLIGQPAFEQARGVLMELCGYTADQALAAIGEIERLTGRAPEDVAAILTATPTSDGLRAAGLPDF